MITRVKIEKFKNIQSFELNLDKVDVLVGGNNAGKSSALQALQFAVSLLQTMYLELPFQFLDRQTTRTLAPEQIIYSPIKDVYYLIYGDEPLREGAGREIVIEIDEKDEGGNINSAKISIKKGRNKNIMVTFGGAKLCEKMSKIDPVFSMYVPGLAGIPFYEEYHSLGAVRRAVARGDCNTILRNVLYHLYQIEEKKVSFLSDLNSIFPDIDIIIDARLDNDGMIDVFVKNKQYQKPIDSMGTGVLQAIQVCAYMNYFEPQLLLLDEPDSHLHPNNQKMMAEMILQLSKKNKNIVLATHSRHLVSALRKDAQITLMKDGAKRSSDYSEYDILMELGAIDEYDVFRDPQIKYIIATEDGKPESNEMLSLILQASGFNIGSFCILPYESCSKIDSAIYMSKCLKRFRSDLQIIVHRDRDGMTSEEFSEFIEKIEVEDNTHCLITKYNDLEMYFCTTDHIFNILKGKGVNISIQEAQRIFDDAMANIRDEALAIYLNRRLDPMRNQGRGVVALEAQQYFESNKSQCLNGHLMIGQIVSELHRAYHLGKKDLLSLSEALCDDSMKRVIDNQ